jgi:hypothetical protein
MRASTAISVDGSGSRTHAWLLLESFALHIKCNTEAQPNPAPCLPRIDRLFWILLSRWWLQ